MDQFKVYGLYRNCLNTMSIHNWKNSKPIDTYCVQVYLLFMFYNWTTVSCLKSCFPSSYYKVLIYSYFFYSFYFQVRFYNAVNVTIGMLQFVVYCSQPIQPVDMLGSSKNKPLMHYILSHCPEELKF